MCQEFFDIENEQKSTRLGMLVLSLQSCPPTTLQNYDKVHYEG
jgi:hypothetical protein